jgi:hypothetical protein
VKFSIRDLLLVTVIVALAVGWGVDRSKLQGRIEAMEAEQAKHEILELTSLPTSQAPAPNPSKP